MTNKEYDNDIPHHEELRNMVDRTLDEHKTKNKKDKIKYPLTLPVVIGKTDNEIILEALKKNENNLLDIERIIEDCFKTLSEFNPNLKINPRAGLVLLSIIDYANKILEDKEFVEWCRKILKEEKNDKL
jgi:hypothetical protein